MMTTTQSMNSKIILLAFIVSIIVSFSLAYNDTPIVDEPPHLSAGFSYLKFNDYSLNPEHPPLFKILAAIPLILAGANLSPQNHSGGKPDQWSLGKDLLYNSNNNTDWIIFLARIPFVLIYIIFGILFFVIVKYFYGYKTAWLSLFFLVFSPTITAHNHLVTTDFGVTALIFLSLGTFSLFLTNPNLGYATLTGLTLGLTLLSKFSAIVIIPIMMLGAIIFWHNKKRESPNLNKKLLTGLTLITLISSGLVAAVYNQANISYSSGLNFILSRLENGSTTFLLGQITDQSFWYYFPVLFFTKEMCGFLILLLMAVTYSLVEWRKWQRPKSFSILLGIFTLTYGFIAITSNLNIGLRHLLPIFPAIYIFTAKKIDDWLAHSPSKPKNTTLFLMLAWIAFAYIAAYPRYIGYFNETVGGYQNGYLVAVDSNLDWGQDLKRLKKFLDENKIEKIKLDYFGGSEPSYYLGDKYEHWSVDKGQTNGWIAVSATYLQNSRWFHLKNGEKDYDWLRERKPDFIIGSSIFVYNID